MKTPKEILKEYENCTDHYADQEYSEDKIIEAMKAYAREACEEQKRICAEILIISPDYFDEILNAKLPEGLE